MHLVGYLYKDYNDARSLEHEARNSLLKAKYLFQIFSAIFVRKCPNIGQCATNFVWDVHRHVVSIYMNCPLLLFNLSQYFNTSNAELNPICHFLAWLGAHNILHVSRIRVNASSNLIQLLISNFINSRGSAVQTKTQAGEEFEQPFKRLGKHVKVVNSENNLCVT